MKRRNLFLTTMLMALFVFAVGCSSSSKTVDARSNATIIETLTAAGNFKVLLAALDQAELTETLKARNPETIFAPTDAAFVKLGQDNINALLKDKPRLIAVLTYHIVSGKYESVQLNNTNNIKTMNGKTLNLGLANGAVTVNNATVTRPDIIASNGVIHAIDTVMFP